MAEHLQRYRKSSLGELLQTQHAAQSAIDSLPDPVIVFDAVGGILNTNQAAESLLGTELSDATVEPLARLEPALRAVLDKVRGHVLSGKEATRHVTLRKRANRVYRGSSLSFCRVRLQCTVCRAVCRERP
jgi:PAS domain-containing protein